MAVFSISGPTDRIARGDSAVTTNSDGTISLTPAAGKNATLTSGQLLLPAGSAPTPPLGVRDTSTGLYSRSANLFGAVAGGVIGWEVDGNNGGVNFNGIYPVGFGVTNVQAPDLFVRRDAPNTLAQRNGTVAQEQRWYETYTDGSNYSRGFAGFRTNSLSVPEFVLGAEKLGTGTLRNVVVPNTLVVRQPGGAAGTNEAQLYADGVDCYLDGKVGGMRLRSQGVNGLYFNGGTLNFFFGPSVTPVVASNQFFCWSNNTNPEIGSKDAGLSRITGSVVGATAGTSGAGWLQNTAGRARVGADVPESAGVLTNVADLTITAKSGRKYFGQYTIFAKNTVGTDGLQFDLGGGTATFTDLEFGFSAQPAGSTLGTVTSTSPTTPVTLTVVSTSDAVYEVSFGFTCNAGGTVILRLAELTHSTGTATVRKGSSLLIEDSPN